MIVLTVVLPVVGVEISRMDCFSCRNTLVLPHLRSFNVVREFPVADEGVSGEIVFISHHLVGSGCALGASIFEGGKFS